MTTQSVPTGLAGVDLHEGSVGIGIDDTLYPLDALYGAAYIFIDRCYVLIDRPAPGRYRVTLAPRSDPTGGAAEARPKRDDALRGFVAEFANELLSCAWRHRITELNRTATESVTTQAIAGAMGSPSLDDLAALDGTGNVADDPIGIAPPWEEQSENGVATDGAAKEEGKEQGRASAPQKAEPVGVKRS